MSDCQRRSRGAHQDLEETPHSLQEQNEGEQNRAEESAERDFAKDGSAEQAHLNLRPERRARLARWCWFSRKGEAPARSVVWTLLPGSAPVPIRRTTQPVRLPMTRWCSSRRPSTPAEHWNR